MVEHQCNWIGFCGYVFAFLFFFIGAISGILGLLYNIKIGKKFGWRVVSNHDDFLLKTPLLSIATYTITIAFGSYFLLYRIGFVIIPQYWDCLMGG